MTIPSGRIRLSSPLKSVLPPGATRHNRRIPTWPGIFRRGVSRLGSRLPRTWGCNGGGAGGWLGRRSNRGSIRPPREEAIVWRHMLRTLVLDRLALRSRKPARPRKRLLRVEGLEDRSMLTLLGQQLFPADNPWNQNIAN